MFFVSRLDESFVSIEKRKTIFSRFAQENGRERKERGRSLTAIFSFLSLCVDCCEEMNDRSRLPIKPMQIFRSILRQERSRSASPMLRDQEMIFARHHSTNTKIPASSSVGPTPVLGSASGIVQLREKREEMVDRRSILTRENDQKDQQRVCDHLHQLREQFSSSGIPFEDTTFPASSLSLFIDGQSFSPLTLSHPSNPTPTSPAVIQWLRPEQIRPVEWKENKRQAWTVFRQPSPNDVIQGALGDCWFMTALSVLAERPEYLKRVLLTPEYNREGIYSVRLCKDGQWTEVLIDDRLPCTKNRHLIYSQAHRKQLWVPLIEKALAKLNGTYESIIAGRCCEGLSIVTGSPCETLFLGDLSDPKNKDVDHDHLWKRLVDAQSKKFLMCAMCHNHLMKKEDFHRSGLLNIHAYSLQDLQEINQTKQRFVKLRNPWGATQQRPAKDVPAELGVVECGGVFWLNFVLFVQYFESVDICKLRSDWYELREEGDFSPEGEMIDGFQLNLNERTEVDLTLYRKINSNLRSQRSEVNLSIAVVQLENQSNGNERIYSIPLVSERGQQKFVSVGGILPRGRYHLLPFLFNPMNKPLQNTGFNLAVHSSHSVSLERVKLAQQIEREYLIKLCLFYGEEVRSGVEQSSERNVDQVRIFELKIHWDGFILLVENGNRMKNVHFQFSCTSSQNASLSRPSSSYRLFDVIPPFHRQLILLLTRKNPSHSFTIGHHFSYHLSSRPFLHSSPLKSKERHSPQLHPSSTDIHLPQPMFSQHR